MYQITPQKLIGLRTDPASSRLAGNSYDLYNRLLNLLAFEEELFNDEFIQEISRPSIEHTDYVEEVVDQINKILKREDQISLDKIKELEDAAKKEFKVPSTFILSGELEKYHQYLLLKSSKTVVEPSVVSMLTACARRVKSKLYVPIKRQEVNCPYKLTSKPVFTSTESKDVFIYVNQELTFTLKNNKLEDAVSICLPVDYMMIDEKHRVTLTNVFAIDKIINFPALYKSEKLNLVASLQKTCLESLGLTPKINYLVCEPTIDYVFDVETFPDIIEELNKAHYHIRNGRYRLPWEYEATHYKL